MSPEPLRDAVIWTPLTSGAARAPGGQIGRRGDSAPAVGPNNNVTSRDPVHFSSTPPYSPGASANSLCSASRTVTSGRWRSCQRRHSK